MITLTIELNGAKQTRDLEKSIVIGRSRSVDVRIDHPKVSGRHAVLELAADGTATLIDAGSRNGLLVAEKKVDRVAVTDGLAVTIGPALFTFTTGGGQARAESLQRLQLPDPGVSGISPPPAPGSGLGTTPLVACGDEGALSERSESKGSDLSLSPAAALLADLKKQPAPEPAPSIKLEPIAAPSVLAPKLAKPRRDRRAPGKKLTAANAFSALKASGSVALSIGLHGFIALLLTVCVYRQYQRQTTAPIKLTLEKPQSLFKVPDRAREGDGGGLPSGLPDAKWVERPAAPAPVETEPEMMPVESASLPDAELAADSRTSDAPPPPAIAISPKSRSRRFVKIAQVADNDPQPPAEPAKPNGNLGVEKKAEGNRSGKGPIDIKPTDDPADLVLGNLGRGQNGGWQTVAQMEPGEIAVVSGDYDTVQRVLDKLKLRYKTIEPKKFGGAHLASVKVLIINCPGELDGSGILKLRSFVDKGGWVVTTDWALSPLKEAFPGYLRNVSLSPETWVPIEANADNKNDPLLFDVFNTTGDAPKWYLEQRSYLFKVDDKAKDKVKVLIESAEMKKKWGTGCVAATFEYGKGRVLHIVSHLQQVSTDPKAHYAMYQFLANWLVQAAAGTKVDEAAKK